MFYPDALCHHIPDRVTLLLFFGFRHLVELELSAGFLTVSGILRDNTFFHGLVETGNKFLELLLGDFLVVGVGGLEELLMGIMELSLGDGVALIRLGVLTITFSGGAAALDISHFFILFVGMFAAYFTEFRKFMQPPKTAILRSASSEPESLQLFAHKKERRGEIRRRA